VLLAIKAITLETVRDMSPQSFQIELRSKHIVIPDYNLSPISCDRRGIMSLNSLKDVVDIESIYLYSPLKQLKKTKLLTKF
jgi:hypothetical protein